MKGKRALFGLAVLIATLAVSGLTAQQRRGSEMLPRPEARFVPKFEAVAETSLLMEGLAQPNYRAVAKHLDSRGPRDAETWKFARGQALLIAETGNLLLLRPPRNNGRDTWMRRGMALRQSAANLARNLANQDLQRSRAALADVTIQCNNCHRTFRVPTRIRIDDE